MIEHVFTSDGVLVVRPSGPLEADDFKAMTDAVDARLTEGEDLTGIMIDAPSFPGWKDFAGLMSHMRFVRENHRLIPKVAVVSNSAFLSALPKFGRHFVSAEIRGFANGASKLAMEWLREPVADPARALRMAWFPDERVIWISVDGKVTTDEYKELLHRVEGIIAEVSPVSFLVNLGDMEGVELGAVAADMKFGLTHLRHFRKIALVGEEGWVRRLVALPNPFSVQVRGFDEESEQLAWDWLSAEN